MARGKKIKEESNINLEKEQIINELKSEITNKVKEDVTKEVIDEIKEDVKVLVYNDVKEDLTTDLEKEIKKENKKILRSKNHKILRRDFFILILLAIVGLLIYYMYEKNYFSVVINPDTTVTNTVDTKKNEIEEDYSYLIDNVKVNLPLDNLNAFYLYTGLYDEVSINSAIKLNIAYSKIKKDEFSEEEMKIAYQEIFGTLKNYQAQDFDYECKHFIYETKEQKYILESNNCFTLSTKEIKEKVTKITQDEDNIIINTVMGVYDSSNNSLYDYQNLYTPIATNMTKNFNLEEYSAYLSSYQYTFKYVDGDYRFNKIVKID